MPQSVKTPIDAKQSSTQPRVIIRCPACETKFAVESSQLADVEIPRFHCSRCDHVFAVEKRELQSPPPRPQPLGGAAPGERPPPWALGDRPRALMRAVEPPPPMQTPIAQLSDSEREDQLTFGFVGSAASAAADQAEAPDDPLPFSFSASRNLENTPPAPQVLLAQSANNATIPASITLTPWRAVAWLSGALLLTLLALVIVSHYFRANPTPATRLFYSAFPSAPHPGAQDLVIQGLRFKRIALESGDAVSTVSGTLVNRGENSLSEILVEGLAFDASGQLVASTRVNAASTLARTRIRSLSMEMVAGLQSGQSARRFELRPGESHDFTIALLDGEPERADYFSARVYSVRME